MHADLELRVIWSAVIHESVFSSKTFPPHNHTTQLCGGTVGAAVQSELFCQRRSQLHPASCTVKTVLGDDGKTTFPRMEFAWPRGCFGLRSYRLSSMKGQAVRFVKVEERRRSCRGLHLLIKLFNALHNSFLGNSRTTCRLVDCGHLRQFVVMCECRRFCPCVAEALVADLSEDFQVRKASILNTAFRVAEVR